MLTIDEDPRWSAHLQKPLLWDHGGHPFQPSTAELYQKRCQLLKLCELVWPRRRKGFELGMYSFASFIQFLQPFLFVFSLIKLFLFRLEQCAN